MSTASDGASESTELGTDEAFCTSCGEIIKEKAEVCPECGVRQIDNSGSSGDIPESRKYELQKIAAKDTSTVMIVSFLITPAGYYMVDKLGLALINLVTLNYLLLGPLIVPFHTRKIIRDSREELERRGETW